MKLYYIQIALFARDEIQRPDLLLNKADEKLGKIFDAPPQIMMNYALMVPNDVPIAHIQSRNNIYTLNIARNRADLIITPNFEENSSPMDSYKNNKQIIEKYCRAILEELVVIRMGVIITLFEPSSNGVKAIYDKYFTEEYCAGCIEANYKINKQTQDKGIVYNHVKTVNAATLHVGVDDHQGVIIQLDTNTAIDPKIVFTSELITNLLNLAIGKIKPSALKELI